MAGLTEVKEAYKYLDRKGIKTPLAHYLKILDVEPNTMYVIKKGAFLCTPVADYPDLLEKAKAKGLLIAQIDFVGDKGHEGAIIAAYQLSKALFG